MRRQFGCIPLLALSGTILAPTLALGQTAYPIPGLYSSSSYITAVSSGCTTTVGPITGMDRKMHYHGPMSNTFTVWTGDPQTGDVRKTIYTVTSGQGTATQSGTAVGVGPGALASFTWNATLTFFDKEAFSRVSTITYQTAAGNSCTQTTNETLLRTSVDY